MKLSVGLAVLLLGALAATGCTTPPSAGYQYRAPTVEKGNVREVWEHLLPPKPQEV